MAKNTVTIGISLSRSLLRRIDEALDGVPRSRYISDALSARFRAEEREKEAAFRSELHRIGRTIIPAAKAAEKMIPIICDALKLDAEIQMTALRLAERAAEEGLGSAVLRRGFAGAAVYIATVFSEFPVTQRSIADVTDVSEVTIRNRMKEMDRTFDLKSAVSSSHGLIWWLDNHRRKSGNSEKPSTLRA